MNLEQGAEFLVRKIHAGVPFFVGKIGTSELDVLIFFTQHRQVVKGPQYPAFIKTNIARNGGIFPATEAAIDAWALHMLTEVLPAGDGFALWNPIRLQAEQAILQTFTPKAAQLPLRSLEPYYVNDLEKQWTYILPNDRKVAVVSPFFKSIEKQWKHIEAVWGDTPIWGPRPPNIIPVKAGYSPYLSTTTGRWSNAIVDGGWRAAVTNIVEQVIKTGALFAIVGCGALSLPVCYALKQRNISAIHTGGATQILFGIKGQRWLTHAVISEFFNDAWVFPHPDEVPTGGRDVEGGCYW